MNFLEGRNIKALFLPSVFMQRFLQLKKEKGGTGEERERKKGKKEKNFRI